jgi:RNA polymerase sigma factor (sigma-70 family)
MEAGAVPRIAPTGVSAFASPRLLRVASDARLVGLIREGRSAAFEAAYDRHHRGILSFCRHMLGDADEAEDAVQHTFMAAYNDLISSEKPIHLRAWLFTIARNRCYSILRARREQPQAEIEETPTEGLAAQVQRRQDLRDLVSDLQRLPDEQRAALVLAELDAMSHAEISEVLGVPRDKVKALVFQARESLVASRTARDTACAEIRQQLAAGRGASLRRANLRRHLRECDGCRDFRTQIERQRKQFAVLLPVAPTIALKEGIIGAAGGGSLIGGGLIASGAIKGGVAKGLVAALIAAAGTAGTVVVGATDLHLKTLLSIVGQHRVVATHAGANSATAGHHHASAAAAVPLASRGVTQSVHGVAVGEQRSIVAVTRHLAVHHRGRATHRARIRFVHPVATRAHHIPAPPPPVYSAPAPVAPVTGSATAGSVPAPSTSARVAHVPPGQAKHGRVRGHSGQVPAGDIGAGNANANGNGKAVAHGHGKGGGPHGADPGANGKGNGVGRGNGNGNGNPNANGGGNGNGNAGGTRGGPGNGNSGQGDGSGATGSGGDPSAGGSRAIETAPPATPPGTGTP